MKKLLLVAVLVLAVAPVYAVTWTYHDFGTNYFDPALNNLASIDAPGYPNQPDPYQPSPGTTGLGGERFDIEQVQCAFDNTYFYVSVTSSFDDSVYTAVWNRYYQEGDLFFGFDGASTTYAIDVSADQLYAVSTWDGIPIVPGGFGNNAFVKAQAGAYLVSGGSLLGSVDEATAFYLGLESNPLSPGNGNTYIKEYRFLLSDLGVNPLDYGYVTFHETVECGNDIVNKDIGIVPEPGTIMLLGMGLLGMGAHLRRRK